MGICSRWTHRDSFAYVIRVGVAEDVAFHRTTAQALRQAIDDLRRHLGENPPGSREPGQKAFQVDIESGTVNAKELSRALKIAKKELSGRRFGYWGHALDFSKNALTAGKELIEKLERFFHSPTPRDR